MQQIKAPSRRAKLIAGYTQLFILNGCFYTWSMLSLAFTEVFHQWTADQMALNGTINLIVSAIAALLVSRLLQRLSTQAVARMSSILFGVGWLCMFLLRWCPSIYLLYIGYAVVGYANGQLYSVIGQVINSCYPERTGAVSGGLFLMTGIGSFFMGMLEQTLVDTVGLFGLCMTFSIGFFALVLLSSRWMTMPEGWSMPSHRPAPSSENEVPIRRALRTSKFWLFFAWAMLLSSGGLLAINNAANIFDYYQAPATAGMLVVLGAGIGCQVMGLSMDRFGLRLSMLGASAFSFLISTLLLVGHWSGQTAAILVGVLLCGIGYGSTVSAKMAGPVKLFGGRNLTAYFGVLNLSIIPAAFLGPYVSGELLMLNAGYLPAFFLIAALFGLALLATILGWQGFAARKLSQ